MPDRQTAADAFETVRFIERLGDVQCATFDRQLLRFELDHGGASRGRSSSRARASLAARPDWSGHDTRGLGAVPAGRFDEAAVEIAAARALGADDARLRFHDGAIRLARGDRAGARRCSLGARSSVRPSTPWNEPRRRAPGAMPGGIDIAAVSHDDAAHMAAHLFCTSVHTYAPAARPVTTDRDLLVQASRLYYELGETQNAIADRLGVTRPQVSRLLKRARAEGIVEIRIVDRTTGESRRPRTSLRRRFRARGGPPRADARRPGGPDPPDRRPARRPGPARARPRRRVVGIGDGASVAAVADALDDAATPVAATVVPLAGGYWSTGPDRDPFRRIADALGAQPHGLMAPGLLDDAATKRALEAHAGVRAVVDLWERLDVAAVRDRRAAVGRRRARHPMWHASSTRPEAVGEILDRPVRPRGRFVCPALRDRVHRVRCARAGGRARSRSASARANARSEPILGALRSGAVWTLVTDVATAEAIVDLDEATRLHEAAATSREPPRHRPRHDRGQGRPRRSRRPAAGDGPGRLRPRHRQRPRLGGAGPGRLVVRGRRRGPRAARRRSPSTSSAIGVDGHGPTLAAVDDRGEATRPAITFLDTRATAEADELAAVTGLRGWALGPLPAALWVERHEPDAAARTRWYLTTWEWLAFRLTGVAAAPLVPGQAVPDPAARLGRDRAPRRPAAAELAASGAVVGRADAETAADALGLRPGIPVAGGTNDAFASYLGAGLPEPGDAYDPGGSAGGFGVYWHEPVERRRARSSRRRRSRGCTASGPRWPRPAGRSTGSATTSSAGRSARNALLEEAGTTPPGADGLVFLPVPRRRAVADLGPGRDAARSSA